MYACMHAEKKEHSQRHCCVWNDQIDLRAFTYLEERRRKTTTTMKKKIDHITREMFWKQLIELVSIRLMFCCRADHPNKTRLSAKIAIDREKEWEKNSG